MYYPIPTILQLCVIDFEMHAKPGIEILNLLIKSSNPKTNPKKKEPTCNIIINNTARVLYLMLLQVGL